MSGHSTKMPRVRVGVVIVEGDQVLLVRHRKGEQTYWLLPGGGLDYGESLAECAAREVHEETGLEVTVEKPIFMSEAIAPDKSRHILNVFVLAHRTGGVLTPPDEAAIEEVAWVPLASLEGLTLHPAIAPQLLAAHAAEFAHDMRYLGSIWT